MVKTTTKVKVTAEKKRTITPTMPGCNIRPSEELHNWLPTYLETEGYLTPAELVRELLRERKKQVERQAQAGATKNGAKPSKRAAQPRATSAATMPGFFVRMPQPFYDWFETYVRAENYETLAELVRELLIERKTQVERRAARPIKQAA